MSYAHVVVMDLLDAGPEFEKRLRALIAHRHEERRAEELDSVRRIKFANMAGRGEVHPDLMDARDRALAKARKSGDEFRAARRLYQQHKAIAEGAPEGAFREKAATEHVRAQASMQVAEEVAREDEKAADEVVAALEAVIPKETLSHVEPLYDAQIEGSIRAVMALLPGVGKRAKRVKVQLGGHVEADPGGDGFASAHVWPEG